MSSKEKRMSDAPTCYEKLMSKDPDRGEEIIREQMANGYRYFVVATGPDIRMTDGPIEERFLYLGFFLKQRLEAVTTFEEIQAANPDAEFPMLGKMKKYMDMKSIGRGLVTGTLSPSDLRTFCTFFEITPSRWHETEALLTENG